MSSSISPWLSKAVEEYRNKHRVNLGFEHKGGYVQIVQFTSYRDKRKPDYDQLGVWAYVHDKQYRALVKFEAAAINEFERNHESFTSYKGGLFHIRAFRFQYTSTYVDRVPSSAQLDLGPKERKLVLSVHSFKYLSSKGESDWSPSARNFDLLAAAWIRDILLDEEEKKGSGIGAKPVPHTKPAQDDVVTAVADEARRKVMRKGGNARQAIDALMRNAQESPLQPNTAAATTATPKRNGERVSPLLGTPSPSQNLTPDFISARKLVQQQTAAKHTTGGWIDNTPTKLAAQSSAVQAKPDERTNSQGEKRKRSVDDNDRCDLGSPEPEEMFTQYSEEAAPISDPPPPSSHASSRSLSPEWDHDDAAAQRSHINGIGDTHGISADTQERIRSLFRLSTPKAKASDVSHIDNTKEMVDEPADSLIQADQAAMLSRPIAGAKKRKKARLPRFELSSQASGDEHEDETMIQEDEEHGAPLHTGEEDGKGLMETETRREDEQPLNEGLDNDRTYISSFSREDIEMVDASIPLEQMKEADADATPTIDTIRNMVVDDQDEGYILRTSDQIQDAKGVFDSHSEASEAESVADEGFEFVKLVPGPAALAVSASPIIKQEYSSSEEVARLLQDRPHPNMAQESQAELTGDAFRYGREDTLEEDPDFITSKTPELDVDSLIDSLNDLAQDESAAAYDRDVQASKFTSNGEALQQLLEVHRMFARAVQKDWLDRVAASKAAKPQSSSSKRRPVYDDDSVINPGQSGPRTSSSGKKNADQPSRRDSASFGVVHQPSTSRSPEKQAQVMAPVPQQPRTSSAAPVLTRSNVSSVSKSKIRGSSVASSAGQKAKLSELVQQQVAERHALIKQHIRSTGLSRGDAVDLWYACSGDFDIARQIALHDVTKSQANEGSQDLNILPLAVQTAYKSCWSFDDDQLVEKRSKGTDPQHQLDLDEIELRRGKGAVEKRRLFLKEDPIAKRLPRKPRYPFNAQ